MMDKEAVKRYFLDFHEQPLPKLLPREVCLKDNPGRIQAVVGARRSGKTYLLFNAIERVISKGGKRELCAYINFEHPLLDGVTFKEFQELLAVYFSLFPEVKEDRLRIFLDEPQVMEKWESAVRGLHDQHPYTIFITGSSSRLLSREIATALRGRSSTVVLLPLSLREFFAFRGINIDPLKLSTRRKSEVLRALDDFFLYGGYPETALQTEAAEKLRIIKDYFDLTIYKDIIERYAIRNSSLARWCMNALISSVASLLNINKLYTALKSRGIKISKDTLYEYFSMLGDCFFAGYLRRFDRSLRKEESSLPKVYLNDTGFISLFSHQEYNKRLENAVYLELTRFCNSNPLAKINYWRSPNDKEVDFLISEKGRVKQAVQVCYSLNSAGTKERELSALKQCFEYFGVKNGLIVTWDDEGIEKVSGVSVPVMPVWKWLLTRKL